jgi:hypothetical protein
VPRLTATIRAPITTLLQNLAKVVQLAALNAYLTLNKYINLILVGTWLDAQNVLLVTPLMLLVRTVFPRLVVHLVSIGIHLYSNAILANKTVHLVNIVTYKKGLSVHLVWDLLLRVDLYAQLKETALLLTMTALYVLLVVVTLDMKHSLIVVCLYVSQALSSITTTSNV